MKRMGIVACLILLSGCVTSTFGAYNSQISVFRAECEAPKCAEMISCVSDKVKEYAVKNDRSYSSPRRNAPAKTQGDPSYIMKAFSKEAEKVASEALEGNLKEEQCLADFETLNNRFAYEEQVAKQQAALIMTGIAVSVAAAKYDGGGGGGGGGSSGKCDCPNDRAKDGSRCGKRSAFCRTGGEEPICHGTWFSQCQ